MKKVIVMQGLPGSGKSTYVSQNYPEAEVCSADSFFMVDGEYKFDASKLREAHRICLLRFLDFLASGEKVVVVDNTNLSLWEMSPYVQIGAAFGYSVEVIRINAPLKLCASLNVHGVPERSLLKMLGRIEDPLPFWPCYFRDESMVDPSDLSFEEIEDHAFCGMTRSLGTKRMGCYVEGSFSRCSFSR